MVVVDGRGGYAGIVSVPEAHATAREAASSEQPVLADLLRSTDDFLTPELNAKEAAAATSTGRRARRWPSSTPPER